MVKDVITDLGRQWNEQMLQQLFEPNTIENILKIHPASAGTPDDYIWTGKKKTMNPLGKGLLHNKPTSQIRNGK